MISSSKFPYHNYAISIAIIFFASGIVLSIHQNPSLVKNINIYPAIVILCIGVPLTLALNAFEYMLMGYFHKKKITFLSALDISILASAGNMLPLPGGAITRIVGLKKTGIKYAHATTTTLLFGVVWFAIALSVSGVTLLFFSRDSSYGWGFLLAGTLLLVLSVLKMLSQGASCFFIFLSLLQRIAIITVDAFRFWGCLLALGVEAKLAQAIIFVLGGVLGSAVSIVPAGLGIREGVSAGLAPLVGLGASAGFLAAALNRLLGLGVLMPTAFSLLLFHKTKDRQNRNGHSFDK